ncbi:MAG: D-alanyl-D-alanine carboxypeptidase family protein [Oscillospiraceae bacterium]|nr:D-alanyl-D-alanine carboxypeptidase family protein [Oscillospiraceae bacterium]
MDKKMRVHSGRYSDGQIRRNRLIAVGVGLMAVAAVGLLTTFLLNTGGGAESPSSQGASSEAISSPAGGEPAAKEPGDSSAAGPESAESGGESLPEDIPEGSASSTAPAEPGEPSQSGEGQTDSPYYEADLPLLVNPDTPMPEDYTADVVDLGNGYKFDRKASAALNTMLDAAKADGVSIWIISAYRSLDRQKELFAQKVSEYEGYGYSPEEAAVQASAWVAVPGTSEHCLGYAVDLNSLEESFENTREFAWLQEHCADYGFILRFPKDKVDITKISYEPWHYRYVGVNHAKTIMSQGICLEEYLANA